MTNQRFLSATETQTWLPDMAPLLLMAAFLGSLGLLDGLPPQRPAAGFADAVMGVRSGTGRGVVESLETSLRPSRIVPVVNRLSLTVGQTGWRPTGRRSPARRSGLRNTRYRNQLIDSAPLAGADLSLMRSGHLPRPMADRPVSPAIGGSIVGGS